MKREQVEAALAELIPTLAEDALDAGEAWFKGRAAASKTKGPKGPNALHMRIGTVDQANDGKETSPFIQWVERTLDGENGAHFAPITADKAWTSAQYFADSDKAVQMYGSAIPDGARRYTGGVCYRVSFTHDDQEYELYIIVACSGVVGTDDRAAAYITAMTFASEWTKALRLLLGA